MNPATNMKTNCWTTPIGAADRVRFVMGAACRVYGLPQQVEQKIR